MYYENSVHKIFYCFTCGKMMFEYDNDISGIFFPRVTEIEKEYQKYCNHNKPLSMYEVEYYAFCPCCAEHERKNGFSMYDLEETLQAVRRRQGGTIYDTYDGYIPSTDNSDEDIERSVEIILKENTGKIPREIPIVILRRIEKRKEQRKREQELKQAA